MARVHISNSFTTGAVACPVCREWVDEFHTEAFEVFGKWMCHDCAEAEFEAQADDCFDAPILFPALTLRDWGSLTACLAGMVVCFRIAWSI